MIIDAFRGFKRASGCMLEVDLGIFACTSNSSTAESGTKRGNRWRCRRGRDVPHIFSGGQRPFPGRNQMRLLAHTPSADGRVEMNHSTG